MEHTLATIIISRPKNSFSVLCSGSKNEVCFYYNLISAVQMVLWATDVKIAILVKTLWLVALMAIV